ncbi:unnamed protein product [Closterium sp. NIES-54]
MVGSFYKGRTVTASKAVWLTSSSSISSSAVQSSRTRGKLIVSWCCPFPPHSPPVPLPITLTTLSFPLPIPSLSLSSPHHPLPPLPPPRYPLPLPLSLPLPTHHDEVGVGGLVGGGRACAGEQQHLLPLPPSPSVSPHNPPPLSTASPSLFPPTHSP